jgi:hypothetical protein
LKRLSASRKFGERASDDWTADERWTREEDQQLLVLFDAEASWPLIAITLERGVEDVQTRAGKLRHEIEIELMAERSIDDRERYVGYATHCLLLAKATADRESRAILKEMAAEWLKLAEAAR